MSNSGFLHLDRIKYGFEAIIDALVEQQGKRR